MNRYAFTLLFIVGCSSFNTLFSCSSNQEINQEITLFNAVNKGNTQAALKAIEDDPKQIHTSDNLGRTVLHLAATRNMTDVVKKMVEKKADVNAGRNGGVNALYFAAQHNNSEMVKTLLDAKSNLTEGTTSGLTAFCTSAINKSPTILEIFFERGIDCKHQEHRMQGFIAFRAAFKEKLEVRQAEEVLTPRFKGKKKEEEKK